MNVETIVQPSGVGGESRTNDQSESGGDFSGVLLGALEEEGTNGGRGASQDGGPDEEPAQFAEGEAGDERAATDDASTEETSAAESEGDGEPDADAGAAASAQAAAESGLAGGVLGVQQAGNRTGLGASDAPSGDASTTALDGEGQQAGNRGELPFDESLEGAALGTENGLANPESAPNQEVLPEGVASPDENFRADELVASAEAGSLTNGPSESTSIDSGSATGGPPASELAAAQNAGQEGGSSRGEDAGARGDSGEGSNEYAQSDRDGARDARDQADQQGQSLAESSSEQAAAAYAAAAATPQADEVIAVENGVPIAAPVASPESAAGTTAASAPSATAPQPAVASDAIAVQTEWLATRGGGSARLRLSPAELGEIEIRVSLRGGAVDVVIVAQEAVAQAIAEEQADRLSQAFSNRDLRMDSFDVRRGDPQAAFGDAPEQFSQSSSQGEGRSEREGDVERGGENGDANQAGVEAGTIPSVSPQIIATGPEASVDLRI